MNLKELSYTQTDNNIIEVENNDLNIEMNNLLAEEVEIRKSARVTKTLQRLNL